MRRAEVLVAALLSACVLGAQVLLPRVFSVLLWYHLAFFAVSLALLGYAAGGVVVRRAVRRTGLRGGGLNLPRLAALAAIALPLALIVVVKLPLDPTALLADWSAPGVLLAMGLLLAVPFALLGTLICALLDRAGEGLAPTYAATFLGGAAGAALTVAAMDFIEPATVLAALAALPLVGAMLLAKAQVGGAPAIASAAGRGSLAGRVVAVAVIALLLLAPDEVLPVDSRKHYPHVPPERVIAEEWNSFSRVTLYENPEHQGLWALPPSCTAPLPDTKGIAIDAWAITPVLRRVPGADNDAVLPYYPPTLFYEGAAPGFDALVIGAGGGIDVQAALAAGARHVTAVELNPLIVDAVRERFRAWTDGLYDDPRVEVVVGEGRAFLERDTRRYDRIVLSGVDTFAATEAGAFALSENFLYTTEAFATYLRHLQPGGVLGMTRWWFEPPRQTLRLALTAAKVLREQGVAQPGLRIFIARAELNSLFLLRNGDFDSAMIARLRAACEQRGAAPMFGLDTPSHQTYLAALLPPDPTHFIATYPYDVEPTTDDRPFFFEYSRLGTLFGAEGDWVRDRMGGQEVLVASFAVLALLCVPLLLLARGTRRPGEASGWDAPGAHARGPSESAGGIVLPFVLLGFGYLAVELPLMQRLALPLGHPVFAVAVVLVALLVWSGLGALLASRVPSARTASVLPWVALLAAVVISGLLVGGHDALVAAIAGMHQSERVAAVIAYLALPGLLLGMPFPLAVRALLSRGGRGAAAADGIFLSTAFLGNGLASVLCGPLATMLAMEVGFRVTLLCGAGCYAGAALLWWRRLPAVSSAE